MRTEGEKKVALRRERNNPHVTTASTPEEWNSSAAKINRVGDKDAEGDLDGTVVDSPFEILDDQTDNQTQANTAGRRAKGRSECRSETVGIAFCTTIAIAN